MEKTTSPTPKKLAVKSLIDFYEALKEVMAGKRITKEEWNDPRYFGVLMEGRLKLAKPDGSVHDWILTDGDILGTDYFVKEEGFQGSPRMVAASDEERKNPIFKNPPMSAHDNLPVDNQHIDD